MLSMLISIAWDMDYILREIDSEFALILFMLAEMPELVFAMFAEMAAEFMLMLIIFAAVI